MFHELRVAVSPIPRCRGPMARMPMVPSRGDTVRTQHTGTLCGVVAGACSWCACGWKTASSELKKIKFLPRRLPLPHSFTDSVNQCNLSTLLGLVLLNITQLLSSRWRDPVIFKIFCWHFFFFLVKTLLKGCDLPALLSLLKNSPSWVSDSPFEGFHPAWTLG